jgi:cobyrinic acid a,c-diamide synthase
MYLSRELIVEGTPRPMAGALDLVVEQTPRPQGHGYVEAEVDRPNPFYEAGATLRGHEFHYSRVIEGEPQTALALRRGHGIGGKRDGVVRGHIWASYMHIHASGTPSWAQRFASLARSRGGESEIGPFREIRRRAACAAGRDAAGDPRFATARI